MCYNPRGMRAEEKEGDRRKEQMKSRQGVEEKGKGRSCKEKKLRNELEKLKRQLRSGRIELRRELCRCQILVPRQKSERLPQSQHQQQVPGLLLIQVALLILVLQQAQGILHTCQQQEQQHILEQVRTILMQT